MKLFLVKSFFIGRRGPGLIELDENDGPGPCGPEASLYLEKSLRETSIEVRRVKIFERKIITKL